MEKENTQPRGTRIWYVAQGYAVAGGHEAHIRHYAEAMRGLGYRPEVVVPNGLPREEHRFLSALRKLGIPVSSMADACQVRVRVVFLLSALPWLLTQWARGRRAFPKALFDHLEARFVAQRLRRKIDEEAPAVIHVLGRLADNLWDVFPPERTIFHHGTEGIRDASWTDAEAEHFREFCEKAAKNFAPGSGVAVNLRQNFGIRRPIETVYTICPDETQRSEIRSRKSEESNPTSDLGPLTSGLRFGILCRFIPEKGIGDILAALRIYMARRGQVSFLFAGQGPLEAEIEDRISDIGPQTSDIRMERVTSPAETLRDIDVFVHPSRSDAMPMAIAEAMMCGKPCLVTRVGGIPDLVRDGCEGLVVDPRSPAQIADAMGCFASMSQAELAAYGARARQRYEEKCRPEEVAGNVAQYYEKILSNTGGGEESLTS